jgi:hypothetical protein
LSDRIEFGHLHATSLRPTFGIDTQDVLIDIAAAFAVRCKAERSGLILTAMGVKPGKNEGDVMTGAGAASMSDCASNGFTSSNACSFTAISRSSSFSSVCRHLEITSSPPLSALLRGMGGGAPPARS